MTMPGSRSCPTCGTVLEPGARFCASCGAAVPAPAPAACTSCGAVLAAGERFCASCGTPRPGGPDQAAQLPASPQGAVVAPPTSASLPVPCPRCGTEIRPPARFCRRCGTSVTGEPPPRRRSNTGLIVAAIAVVAALVAGAVLLLSGGDDDGTTVPAGSSATPGSGDATRPGGGNTPGAPTATEPPLTTDSGRARAEVESLLARGSDQVFRVEYDAEVSERETGVSVRAKVTIASAAPRFALVLDAGPQGIDLSEFDPETTEVIQSIAIISNGDLAWACFKAVGQDGECQESVIEPGDDSFDLGALFDEALASGSDDDLFQAEEVRGQRIAGRDARCYRISRSEAADVTSEVTFTVCIDREQGIPLLLEGSATAEGALDQAAADGSGIGVTVEQERVDVTVELRATSVAFTASEADFVPMYAVVPAD